MNKLLMPYEAPELFLISVRVEKGFAVSSDIEPGEGGGELGYDANLLECTHRIPENQHSKQRKYAR